ncbi:MAG: UvrABC system protein A [Phycisphaerae bacterium]|nr:UvrABC system protein A [Phycisphaerae bacterium]
MSNNSTIVIRGAREHNLRGVNLELPRNQLICFTGVSGSGKSSLAFDTLYAEGQRRYIESLSTYARQFMGQLKKPEVELISGLSPAISIQQKTSGWNPRSTVGTVTQIHDYLRVLFARLGTQHCVQCGQPIAAQSREQLLGQVQALPAGSALHILAPVVRGQKGEFREQFGEWMRSGYVRARVDGRITALEPPPTLERNQKHDIELVIDRLVLKPENQPRLAEAVENALRLGQGSLIIAYETTGEPRVSVRAETRSKLRDLLLSSHYACVRCNLSYEPPSPQLFSFNSPVGMCLTCDGLGSSYRYDPEMLVPDPTKSFLDGAITTMSVPIGRWRRHLYEAVARQGGFELHTPWRELPAEARHALLYGTGEQHLTYEWKWRGGIWRHGGKFAGVIADLQDKHRQAKSNMVRAYYEKFMRHSICADCGGARLNRQGRAVRLGGLNLVELEALPIDQAREFLRRLELSATQKLIAAELLKEIDQRLEFLLSVGLHYLTLSRIAPTLSGGESQRIRLASQIGSGLTGVLYVLDEPSIGLHPRDQERLLDSLCRLRDLGNTVVVVEHDEETMRTADRIVDFGPGPGVRGGEVVAEGTPDEVMQSSRSLTGQYLAGTVSIAIPENRRAVNGELRTANSELRKQKKSKTASNISPAVITIDQSQFLILHGARHNNLQNIDVTIPLGRLVCVTGVSGSGKSSLVLDTIRERLVRDLNGAATATPGEHDALEGLEHLDKVIDIDQSPIGRTPRSNPATYIKLFDLIRELYTRLPDAKVRGYKPGRFSFNVATGRAGGGRCEACEGYGSTRVEMDFLADVWVTCVVCGGARFNKETLQVRYKGRSIAEVLDMDVQQALDHFANVPRIRHMLQTLHDVGLDYLKLGQSSTTLSGGEAQRIKLARELVKRATGRTLYILDEPTTGLHFEDIRRLLAVLHGFVESGNSVLVVEHNLDVIKTADWVIDLGPEGGAGGGRVVAEGTPEAVAQVAESYTGQALRPILGLQKTENRKEKNKNGKQKSENLKFEVDDSGLRTSRARQRAVGRRRNAFLPIHGGSVIRIEGACEHNLRNVSVEIPHGQTTVFTGVSGSGKTSLAMDTLYTEGHRRYVESLSAYARQFLGQLQKPKVEHVAGLLPAIAIEQKSAGHTPRSTIGTVTEIYDYLRVLYARLGQAYCPRCQVAIGTQSSDEIVERIMAWPRGSKLLLLAPIERSSGEKYQELFAREKQNGYARVRVDGQVYELDQSIPVNNKSRHRVELVVDRVVIQPAARSRIADSVEQTLAVGEGVMVVAAAEADGPAEQRFSQLFSCHRCGSSYEELTPHHFSFNNRLGWCDSCQGLGVESDAAEEVNEWLGGWTGEVATASPVAKTCPHCAGSRLMPLAGGVRFGNEARSFSLAEIVLMPLSEVLNFFKSINLPAAAKKIAGELLHEIRNRLQFLVDVGLDYVTLHRSAPTLSGGESQRIRLASQLGSGLSGVLYVLDEPTVGLHPRDNDRLIRALAKLRDLGNTLCIVEHDRDVIAHADAVLDFGPGAGVEGGRIVGHDRPNRLHYAKESLTGQYLAGQAAIAVPSNRRIVKDELRIAYGELRKRKKSKTTPSAIASSLASPDSSCLILRGARANNLKCIDVAFPLGRFTAVTGVSGSGKSTLVNDILYRAMAMRLHRALIPPAAHERIDGLKLVDKVISVDQSPIGQTPGSNPATYTGLFDLIRELFARLPEAKVRGYGPNRFSFNRPGGRCEKCFGLGETRVEMHFLPDVWITCEECRGQRYNPETLQVRYRGKNIYEVLQMRVSEAMAHFSNVPKLRAILRTLDEVGLGYLPLGQSSATLSGGEAQRLKLAAELARPSTGKTVYILDEPTTGLHFEDVRRLLDVLHRLVDLGNTVICIEHNLELIKTADWIIDLGPEAGASGGEVVVAGPPEAVAVTKSSYTGKALQAVLAAGPVAERAVFTREESARRQAEMDARLEVRGEDAHVKMPWEANGRRWHLEQCLAMDGQRPRWEPAALEWIVEQIEAQGGSSVRESARTEARGSEGERPALLVDWGQRSVIEIRVTGSGPTAWFAHILTRGNWLLECTFRVGKRKFDDKKLNAALGLKTLDERTELPVYGQWRRVKRRVGREFDDIRIWIHDLAEIQTPAFEQFLNDALASHRATLAGEKKPSEKKLDWRNDGRSWHLAQQAITKRRKIEWPAALLAELVGKLSKLEPKLVFDWNNKMAVMIRHPQVQTRWGRIVTSEPQALRVELYTEPGEITPLMFNRLGMEPHLVEAAEGQRISFRLQGIEQLDNSQLRGVMQRAKELLK